MQIHIDTNADEVAALVVAIQEHRGATTGPVKLDGKALGKTIEEATRHRLETAAKETNY